MAGKESKGKIRDYTASEFQSNRESQKGRGIWLSTLYLSRKPIAKNTDIVTRWSIWLKKKKKNSETLTENIYYWGHGLLDLCNVCFSQ